MKLLIDENVPNSIIKLLDTYDILDLKKHNRGLRDSAVIRLAIQEQRVILSQDMDFLKLHRSMKEQFSAIILHYTTINSCKEYLPRALKKIDAIQSEKHIIAVLDEKSITVHSK